ncbi:hypothetical protein [Methylocystis sp.]|nr:hypothetical protein [Methylocystis sp.]MDP3554814.1 hypothetical protein [Methylocystis sp.]
MNFDPNMLQSIVERVMWGVVALLATKLLVRLILGLMRQIERLP